MMSSQPTSSWRRVFSFRSSRPSSAAETNSLSEAATLYDDNNDDTDTYDQDTLALSRFSSNLSQTTVGAASRDQDPEENHVDQNACEEQHHTSSSHSAGIRDIFRGRGVIDSERVLYLCAHAFMTWDQFRREIVDVFPYHSGSPSAPNFLTLTYARDSGLSLRDAVMRHKQGSHCQSWEGAYYDTAYPVPHAYISFQIRQPNQILSYVSWHIATQEVWRKEENCFVQGRGPAHATFPRSKPKKSPLRSKEGSDHAVSAKPATVDQAVRLLAERLTSLEIYLCPHLDFFSPVLRRSLALLWEERFASDSQSTRTSSECSKCGASLTIYISGGGKRTDDIVIIIARVIGKGSGPNEKEWLNATERRAKQRGPN